MKNKSGNYYKIFVGKNQEYVSIEDEAREFCNTWIKPVHPKDWDWTTRDFEDPKNAPTIEEARAIRDLVLKNINTEKDFFTDLSSMPNVASIKVFLDPKNKNEAFNMEEFAFALEVELEHGKIKDANVTGNHPFLTALIALAHMSESITYYKRLQVMELEAEIFELERKIKQKGLTKKLEKALDEAKASLKESKKELRKRLRMMKDIPVVEET